MLRGALRPVISFTGAQGVVHIRWVSPSCSHTLWHAVIHRDTQTEAAPSLAPALVRLLGHDTLPVEGAVDCLRSVTWLAPYLAHLPHTVQRSVCAGVERAVQAHKFSSTRVEDLGREAMAALQVVVTGRSQEAFVGVEGC